jgi:hypothetical protein
MPKTLDYEAIYRECKVHGVKSVARRLGKSYQQLVAEIAASGVAGTPGLPSRREIRERQAEVQAGWSDYVRQARFSSARSRNVG